MLPITHAPETISRIEEITQQVCVKFDTTRDEILSPYRGRRVSRARQVVAYELRVKLGLSPSAIGLILGRSRISIQDSLKAFEARRRGAA